MTKYYVGDSITANGSFDAEGVATDPTTVTLKVLDPSGEEFVYVYPDTINRAAAGRFYVNFAVDTDGVWTWKWIATGDAPGVQEGRWYVRPTRIP